MARSRAPKVATGPARARGPDHGGDLAAGRADHREARHGRAEPEGQAAARVHHVHDRDAPPERQGPAEPPAKRPVGHLRARRSPASSTRSAGPASRSGAWSTSSGTLRWRTSRAACRRSIRLSSAGCVGWPGRVTPNSCTVRLRGRRAPGSNARRPWIEDNDLLCSIVVRSPAGQACDERRGCLILSADPRFHPRGRCAMPAAVRFLLHESDTCQSRSRGAGAADRGLDPSKQEPAVQIAGSTHQEPAAQIAGSTHQEPAAQIAGSTHQEPAVQPWADQALRRARWRSTASACPSRAAPRTASSATTAPARPPSSGCCSG